MGVRFDSRRKKVVIDHFATLNIFNRVGPSHHSFSSHFLRDLSLCCQYERLFVVFELYFRVILFIFFNFVHFFNGMEKDVDKNFCNASEIHCCS